MATSDGPGYRARVIDRELDLLFADLSAVSLDGPKGVGKTETALQRVTRIFRFDRPADRELLAAQPGLLHSIPPTLLLDEWQRWPEIWDLVRRAVDEGAPAGSYLLTGSATPTAQIHTGAGRIVPLRMRPMTLAERGVGQPTVSLAALLRGAAEVGGETDVRLDAYVEEILASGYPGIRSAKSTRGHRAQLGGYLDRLFDHEVTESGSLQRRPAAMRQWLTAYAAATATTAAYETVRDAATPGESQKPTKVTALGYRDALQRLWILDPVEAWVPSRSSLTRLTAAPKHHLADPALAAQLLSLTAESLVGGEGPTRPRDGAMLGPLFESLATLSVRVFAQAAEARVGHLRTQAGRHEVDLVVSGEAGRVLAIEVKLGATPSDADVRHLHWLRNELGEELIDAVVLTAGPYAYRRPDGVAVVPLALLGP
ncbi:ATP-binding protein [uncultured Friedmanniella sp.]|uniref:ATP-binding protein n=1 Tax=uncultured Friedmanniella sp. TaxID=335381 RepID=UPI0035CA27E2